MIFLKSTLPYNNGGREFYIVFQQFSCIIILKK
ncbi:hypothetical protein O163_04450 [Caldanaerobacter subterraneus subsp. yonseiensis KB-1]|uniref:Uncharacterized protein n=1 Tax=Caldanaerobacter subterraneus subsp. yonseiensis KB-1 TaxID=1388761 RepID=U5CRS5_CALSX|nr:hypothetical protein O163_04450 [Caldanaerobacter subterraneus subsp. yonseiensis KB-1]